MRALCVQKNGAQSKEKSVFLGVSNHFVLVTYSVDMLDDFMLTEVVTSLDIRKLIMKVEFKVFSRI